MLLINRRRVLFDFGGGVIIILNKILTTFGIKMRTMIGDKPEMLFSAGNFYHASKILSVFRFQNGKISAKLLNSPTTTRVVVARHPIIRFWSAWNQKFLKGLWLRKLSLGATTEQIL